MLPINARNPEDEEIEFILQEVDGNLDDMFSSSGKNEEFQW